MAAEIASESVMMVDTLSELADVCWVLGKENEARQAWEKLLKYNERNGICIVPNAVSNYLKTLEVKLHNSVQQQFYLQIKLALQSQANLIHQSSQFKLISGNLLEFMVKSSEKEVSSLLLVEIKEGVSTIDTQIPIHEDFQIMFSKTNFFRGELVVNIYSALDTKLGEHHQLLLFKN